MEKLEKFLDQICQGIGGPLEMRRHVRQELREHLLDAIAQHKAAGMADEAALDKALEEFGKPEEVRSELEATHGQRMTWIIDKAMQWKEMTMKAKWLWTTWAHLALMGVIALEALFITFNVMFIIPKFEALLSNGIIDSAELGRHELRWMTNFLYDVSYVGGHHAIWLILVPAALWALFEWRIKSENKTFMRLSALGTVAVGLMIVVVLMAGSLVIIFCIGVPTTGMVRPWAVERVESIDKAVESLEEARRKKDWPRMHKHADQAAGAARLLNYGPAVTSLTLGQDWAKVERIRSGARGLDWTLKAAQEAIREHDDARLDKALRDFHKAFAPVREAAQKQAVR
jgi:hypothetical protein